MLRLFRLRTEHWPSVRAKFLRGRRGCGGSDAGAVRLPGKKHSAVRHEPWHGGVRQAGHGKGPKFPGRGAAGATVVGRPFPVERFPLAAMHRPVQHRAAFRQNPVSRVDHTRRVGQHDAVQPLSGPVQTLSDHLRPGDHRRHGTHSAVQLHTVPRGEFLRQGHDATETVQGRLIPVLRR